MRRARPLWAAGVIGVLAAFLPVHAGREAARGARGGGAQRSDGVPAVEMHGASAAESPRFRSRRSNEVLSAKQASGGASGPFIGGTPGPALGETSITRFLASHSSDELAFFARFERLTGRAASPAVVALLEHRRAGATPDELVALATRSLAGDPLGRAAALEWIRASSKP